jgi:molecular chaperone GrpE
MSEIPEHPQTSEGEEVMDPEDMAVEGNEGADSERRAETGESVDSKDSEAPDEVGSGDDDDASAESGEREAEASEQELASGGDDADDGVLFLEPDDSDEGIAVLEMDDSDDTIVVLEVDDSDDEIVILDTGDEPGEATGGELERAHSELLSAHEVTAGELQAAKDRLLRTAADYENFRRRSAKEKQDLDRYAGERVIRDFLPVIDNLERALGHADVDAEDAGEGLREGVEMVVRQFQQALEKYGVAGFDSAGEKFDPERHEAIQQVESEEHDTGTVVTEFQRGYQIHERLLRPALVVVARNAADPEP